MRDEDLIKAAMEAMNNSYSPYSGYRVGAVLLCLDGRVFAGCNVENISFGGTICAERTAFVKAVSEGAREFVKIAICVSGSEIATPCGICRQVLAELCNEDFSIICANNAGEYKEYKLCDLLPHGFFAKDVARKSEQ